MSRLLSGVLLVTGLLFSVFSAQALTGQWHNSTTLEPLSVQTRFEFPVEFLTGALLVQRTPPLCQNAELAFEVGPATFSEALEGKAVTARFKVDYFTARKALFRTYLQQRDDGPYLFLRMVSLERASTLLTEVALGINLQISFTSEFPDHVMNIELSGSGEALREALVTCAEQAIAIEQVVTTASIG